MSADLEKWQYGDPEKVMIRAEEKTCRGCKTIEIEELWGDLHVSCANGKPGEVRCGKYKPG